MQDHFDLFRHSFNFATKLIYLQITQTLKRIHYNIVKGELESLFSYKFEGNSLQYYRCILDMIILYSYFIFHIISRQAIAEAFIGILLLFTIQRI